MVFTIQYRQLTFACLPTASPDPFPYGHHSGPYLCESMKLPGSQMPFWLAHAQEQGGEMAGENKAGEKGVTFTELNFSAIAAWQTTPKGLLKGSENQTRESSLMLTLLKSTTISVNCTLSFQ